MDLKTGNRKNSKKSQVIIRSALVVVLIGAALIYIYPKRSVEAYCRVYKEEDNKLASETGTTYSVAVFNHRSNNPKAFADAFGRLERVAPNEIEPEVRALKDVFVRINKDQSQALSASMSGLAAETNVRNWTNSHCK